MLIYKKELVETKAKNGRQQLEAFMTHGYYKNDRNYKVLAKKLLIVGQCICITRLISDNW